MRYRDRIVLITGAAGGFGRAAAQRFAGEGAALVLSDVDAAGLDAAVETARAEGARVALHSGDVTDPDAVAALVATAYDRFGRLDVAINNAGVAHAPRKVADTDLDTFQRMLAVNLTGTFLCMRAQIQAMRAAGGGVILNVASVAGLVGAPLLGAYAAAKHGVVGLTRTAAAEVAGNNIRVNALCPSYADTSMVERIAAGMRGSPQEAVARMVQGIPISRLVTPAEVAAAMAWMCSDENSFMTGHAMPLDGGGTAT